MAGTAKASTPGPETGPRRLVLVVEDDPVQREATASALREAGFRVDAAANGVQALTYLRTGPPPDLILLDMLLPARDGWDLLEAHNRDPAAVGVPVLITTALGVAGKEWATSLGAAGYLRKPFGADTLLREVRRCLRKPR